MDPKLPPEPELDGPAEMEAAHRLSEQIDRLLAGHPVEHSDPMLTLVTTLTQLNQVLPPVDPALEERIIRLASPQRRVLRLPLRPLVVAAATLLVILTFTLALTGQPAIARLATIFQLDSVKIGINIATATPAQASRLVTPRIEKPLASIEEAQQVAPVPIQVPIHLPAGWALQDLIAVYYPDLPARIPLNIILRYESPTGARLEIIEYFLQLGDGLTVDSLSRFDDTSTMAQPLTIQGRPGILVTGPRPANTQTLIWQANGVLLEVSAQQMDFQTLLEIVQSIQPLE